MAAGMRRRDDILSLSRLQFLQRIYSLKYDASVAEALSSALHQSTRTQYEHSWKDFHQWLVAHPDKTHHKSNDPPLPNSPGSLEGTQPHDYPSLKERPQTPAVI